MVASDRISTYDVVHPEPDPRQGQGADRAVGVLVRADRRDRARTTSSRHRRARRGARARAARRAARDGAGRVRRARLHHGVGLEGLQRHGSVCGIELPAGLAESRAAAGADLHAGHEGRDRRARRERRLRPRRRDRRRPRPLLEELRELSLELYELARRARRERGIILADTKFEFGRDADGTIVLGDEVLTPDSSRFWPADGYEPGRRAAVVRQAVRARLGRRDPAGTSRRPRPSCPTRWSQRTRAQYVEAYERITASRSTPGWRGPALRVRVLIRPKEGILDPQGQAVERALPALGFEGVAQRARRAPGRARRATDAVARVEEMCERLLANPLIEDYEVQAWTSSAREVRRRPLPRLLRRGRRAARLPRASAEAELLWHGDRDLEGVDAVVVPGGFSYGDYLRAGAIARFSPVMEAVDRVRPRGRPGARDLQRLPGAVRGGPAAGRAAARTRRCGSSAARSSSWRRAPDTPFTRACVPGERAVDARQAHDRPLLRAAERSTSSRRTGRSLLRYAAGHEPERLAATTSPASATRQGNVFGLMPHPEHAVDELTGSADGVRLFGSLAAHARGGRAR